MIPLVNAIISTRAIVLCKDSKNAFHITVIDIQRLDATRRNDHHAFFFLIVLTISMAVMHEASFSILRMLSSNI